MTNFDFATKELVKSFSYTTINQDREACTDVNIDGRWYTKHGTLQAVTVVGNLYKDENGNKTLHCGVTRQHPCDSRIDKQLAYEQAQQKAFMNPDIIINTVPECLTKYNFNRMIEWYIDMIELQFVKTRKEIENNGQDVSKYNR